MYSRLWTSAHANKGDHLPNMHTHYAYSIRSVTTVAKPTSNIPYTFLALLTAA